MSIKMTYAQLNNESFLNAVRELGNQKLPVKVAYSVKKLIDSIHSARTKIASEYKSEIIEKFGKMGDDGSFDIEDTKKDEAKQAAISFGDKEIDLGREKLYLESLQTIDLTASQLSSLEPVVTEFSAG